MKAMKRCSVTPSVYIPFLCPHQQTARSTHSSPSKVFIKAWTVLSALLLTYFGNNCKTIIPRNHRDRIPSSFGGVSGLPPPQMRTVVFFLLLTGHCLFTQAHVFQHFHTAWWPQQSCLRLLTFISAAQNLNPFYVWCIST